MIARYNENLTWLDIQAVKLSLDDVYIYNKNNKTYKPGIYKNNYILPNVGREAHTYLTYIVENYDRLKEYTMFYTPDWPNAEYALYPPYLLGMMQRCNRVTNFIEADYYLNNNCGYSICKAFRLYNFKTNLQLNKDNLMFGDWMIKYIEPKLDKYVKDMGGIFTNYQGSFCVRRENILSRPKEFYAQFIPQLDQTNPELGHFFERAWFYLFNMHTLNPPKRFIDYLIQPVRYYNNKVLHKEDWYRKYPYFKFIFGHLYYFLCLYHILRIFCRLRLLAIWLEETKLFDDLRDQYLAIFE